MKTEEETEAEEDAEALVALAICMRQPAVNAGNHAKYPSNQPKEDRFIAVTASRNADPAVGTKNSNLTGG
jgi:hypothetical protein